MTVCAVKSCKNYTTKKDKCMQNITFHKFPKDPVAANRWTEIIRRARNESWWNPKPKTSICSAHFCDKDTYITKSGLRKLRPGAVPSKVWCLMYVPILENAGSSTTNLQPEYLPAESNISIASQQEDSLQSENEIKVFCPKCDTEVSHTADGIQEDQTKILIAKVYHYFEQEYEELKTIYGDLDLTPLSKFRQRTALATGVSETKILEILKEEEGRNADKRQGQSGKPRGARKRSRQTDSSSEEDSSDDNVDDNEESSHVNEAQMVIVKEEPTEYYNFSEEPLIYVSAAVKEEPSDIEVKKEQTHTDPISTDVKTEPTDVEDITNETLALNDPTGTKRKGRKVPRSDVTSTRQHTQGESSTAAASSSGRLAEQLDESSLFGDIDMKAEEIEIHEEGVS